VTLFPENASYFLCRCRPAPNYIAQPPHTCTVSSPALAEFHSFGATHRPPTDCAPLMPADLRPSRRLEGLEASYIAARYPEQTAVPVNNADPLAREVIEPGQLHTVLRLLWGHLPYPIAPMSPHSTSLAWQADTGTHHRAERRRRYRFRCRGPDVGYSGTGGGAAGARLGSREPTKGRSRTAARAARSRSRRHRSPDRRADC
jgi:hypothetical protein